MVQVRAVMQVKFGKIDQAVELFRRIPVWESERGRLHYHVLTDISGPMYTLVTEVMLPALGDWEPMRTAMFAHPDYAAWFKEFQLYVEGGRYEFYNVEGECLEWSRPGVVVVRQVYRALKWQIRPAVEVIQRYGALLTHFGVGRNPRILTEVSGPMFQVVIEIETEGLSEWETQRRGFFREPEFQAWFAQLRSQVEAGMHEFYRVEA
jgi:hypothetical protein